MRSIQHSEQTILFLLREVDAGVPIDHVCQTAGVSTRTFYRWRAQYGGLTLNAARERNDLLRENLRLRALVKTLSQGHQEMAPGPDGKAIPPSWGLPAALPAAAREARSPGRFGSVRGQR